MGEQYVSKHVMLSIFGAQNDLIFLWTPMYVAKLWKVLTQKDLTIQRKDRNPRQSFVMQNEEWRT